MVSVYIWPVSGRHMVPQLEHTRGLVHFVAEQFVKGATPDLHDRPAARAAMLARHVHECRFNGCEAAPPDHVLDVSVVAASLIVQRGHAPFFDLAHGASSAGIVGERA
eukprot:6863289-Pyramimonas_sp.AAC.1